VLRRDERDAEALDVGAVIVPTHPGLASALGPLLAERPVHDALDKAVETELSDHVRSCIQALTPREAFVVQARFGLETGEGHTLEEIGQALQLIRERVPQIEARAMSKLRHPSSDTGARDLLAV